MKSSLGSTDIYSGAANQQLSIRAALRNELVISNG